MWTKKNFNKLTEILREAGQDNWPRLCTDLNVRNGQPNFVVVDAKCGSKLTADNYSFDPCPYYDAEKGTVTIVNPHSIAASVIRQMSDTKYPVLGSHIEMDADVALKLLVLGAPNS